MRHKTLWSLLIICLFGMLQAGGTNIKFKEYDLDNGLHVILHQDNSVPIVVVSVMYHVGSKNEQADRTGFAHFFEHLMFEGSENIKRGEFFQYVQNAGGQVNANTSFDRTFYYEKLPSNQLELALWLESERMLHAKIDSVGVETQRSVVKEERRQRLDNQPYGSILEQTFSHAYRVHPYRWTPIGSFQYIDRATIEEFREFYNTFYVPQNAVLAITGDINIKKTKKLIEQYFGDIPRGTREIYRPNVVEPPQTAEVRDTVYDNIQLPAVIQAYHIPAQGTDDFYAIEMLTTLLAQGRSSRLYKEIVDRQQKAVQAGSFPFSLEDPGLFLVYAIANMGVDAADLEAAVNQVIESTKAELISEKEFQKLRNQMENNLVLSKRNLLRLAESLSSYYLFFGNTNLINTEIERYMKVTREDIRRVANRYLTKQNRTVLYYLPKSEQPKEEGN